MLEQAVASVVSIPLFTHLLACFGAATFYTVDIFMSYTPAYLCCFDNESTWATAITCVHDICECGF